MIRSLDEQKDAAIERTFKMVAKFFTEVFTELTGQGSAQLLMQRRPRTDGTFIPHYHPLLMRLGEESDDGDRTASVRQYVGVDIQVSFTSSGKLQRMHQLSGGQKSLVALALIFAIQRCDPAPFYIFDEIDAALDDTHRLGVAEMIQRQSEDTQFICTTHRPEMIRHANKLYIIQVRHESESCLQRVFIQYFTLLLPVLESCEYHHGLRHGRCSPSCSE